MRLFVGLQPSSDFRVALSEVQERLRSAGVTCVDEMIYAGMRHEIHNEIGHEQVYDDIASWIEEAVVH